MKELKCKFCGKICGREGTLAIHERSCSQNPESKNFGKEAKEIVGLIQESWKQENGLYKCPHCGKDFTKNGIATHIYFKHTEAGKNYLENEYENKGHKAWNKGLTKEIDERILKSSETYKFRIQQGIVKRPTCHKTKEECRLHAIKQGLGGVHYGAGRGKHGWYNNIWCDSSWELAYVIYCLDHNIQIERCKEYFEYEYQGKKHRYYPDFVVNDEIVEIKGYFSEQYNQKLKYLTKKILIIGKEEIKPYIQYVIETYGKNYINLYSK